MTCHFCGAESTKNIKKFSVCDSEKCFDALIFEALKKVHRKQKKQIKAKSFSAVAEDTKKSVNAYIRARDNFLGFKCISCGKGRNENAGHYVPTGKKYEKSFLRFSTANIHGQCVYCNKYNSGNLVKYTAGLSARYGEGVIKDLENQKKLADQKKDQLTIEIMLKIRKYYILELKGIKNGSVNVFPFLCFSYFSENLND